MRPTLFALVTVLLTAGCAWFGGDDEEELEPAKLVELDNPTRIQKLWETGVGGSGEAVRLNLVPAFGDGKVYAASYEGNLTAVDAESGRRAWRYDADVLLSGGPTWGSGLVVAGGIDGDVIAVDAETGSARWRARVSSEVMAAPAIQDGVVVVRSLDGRVYGLDAADGARRWVFDRGVPLLSVRGNARPLARAGLVFIGYDSGKIAALRAETGELLWEETLAAPQGRSELERMVDIDGAMAIVASELYAVGFQGRLGALDVSSGRVLWARKMSSYGGLSVSRTQLFLTDVEDGVTAVDRRSGGTLWRQDKLLRRQITSPASVGDHVVVGDFDGFLHWLDEEDGTLAGRARIDGSAVLVPPLAIGSTIYALSSGGTLAAFRVAG